MDRLLQEKIAGLTGLLRQLERRVSVKNCFAENRQPELRLLNIEGSNLSRAPQGALAGCCFDAPLGGGSASGAGSASFFYALSSTRLEQPPFTHSSGDAKSMNNEQVPNRWWVANGNQHEGPFGTEEIQLKLQRSKLSPDQLICPVGGNAWTPLIEWSHIFVTHEEIPPPPPLPLPVLHSYPKSRDTSGTPHQDKQTISRSDISEQKTQEHPKTKKTPTHDTDANTSIPISDIVAETSWNVPSWVLFLPLFIPFFLPDFGSTPDRPWAFAGVAAVVGGLIFYFISNPSKEDSDSGVGAFIFVFLAALPILFIFHEVISQYAGQSLADSVKGHPVQKAITSLMWVIANGYSHAYYANANPDTSFFPLLICMFLSVALCEEAVKLSPLLYLVKEKRIKTSTGAAYIGAMSGLGFGVIEGIWYHFSTYVSLETPLSIYLVRFFSVAILHGCWTSWAASNFYKYKDNYLHAPEGLEGMFQCTMIVFVSIVGSMTLHSFYNALLGRSFLLVLLVILLSGYFAIKSLDPSQFKVADELKNRNNR